MGVGISPSPNPSPRGRGVKDYMKKDSLWKIVVVLALVLSVAAVVAVKRRDRPRIGESTKVTADQAAPPASAPSAAPAVPTTVPAAPATLPRILDLGSNKCQACLRMVDVLKELRDKHPGRLQVDFIDIFEQPAEAEKYKITLIPTQIFYDREGREIFRHQGFYSTKEILDKFGELGVTIGG